MPDISMCKNEDCPSKHRCYRFTTTPNPSRQSYAAFSFIKGDYKCVYFMSNHTEEEDADE